MHSPVVRRNPGEAGQRASVLVPGHRGHWRAGHSAGQAGGSSEVNSLQARLDGGAEAVPHLYVDSEDGKVSRGQDYARIEF